MPKDFLEETNLAGPESSGSIREKLQAALDKYPMMPAKQSEFGDPLL